MDSPGQTKKQIKHKPYLYWENSPWTKDSRSDKWIQQALSVLGEKLHR